MTEYRCFIAHNKDKDATAIRDDIVAYVQAHLPPGYTVRGVTGAEDFAQNFVIAGSFDAWAEHAGAGMIYGTREPRYHAFICLEQILPRGTALIVAAALGAGRKVLYWQGNKLVKVTRVREVRHDWWHEAELDLDTAPESE
jgi:hypothetical protein